MLATVQGKEYALSKLKERRLASKTMPRIDNGKLYAGSPMYYYCICCGDLAAILPEAHLEPPPRLCPECQAMKDLDWLE